MNGICIELYDGREGGPISISSDSNFKAIRVRREDIPKFESELKNRGVYILLIGKNCAYVGKTADSLAT